MNAHASRDKYGDFPNWNASYPYCLHSDWSTGLYTNFYQLSNHVADFDDSKRAKFGGDPYRRIGWNLGLDNSGEFSGVCNYEGPSKCKPGSKICHRLSAENMTTLAKADIMNTSQLSQTID